MSTILRETQPVARKEHQCCLCLEAIAPGERHWYQVNIGEEWGFCAIRACRFCWEQSRHLYEPWSDWGSDIYLDLLRDRWAGKLLEAGLEDAPVSHASGPRIDSRRVPLADPGGLNQNQREGL